MNGKHVEAPPRRRIVAPDDDNKHNSNFTNSRKHLKLKISGTSVLHSQTARLADEPPACFATLPRTPEKLRQIL